jgi:hypothetical protein
VHALHRIHAVLEPGGLVVDTQPVSARPPVQAGNAELGALDMRDWRATIDAVDGLVGHVIAEGLFALESESSFAVTDEFDDGAELVDEVSGWQGTRIPDQLARRAVDAAPPLAVHQEVRMRLLRAM